MREKLLEKWEKIIDVKGQEVPSVPETLKEQLAILLENEEKYIQESASRAEDMAQFTPILVPAVRRIFPKLLAHEVVGVQPMNAPTGYAYALRYAYAGKSGDNIKGVTNVERTNGPVFDSVAVVADLGIEFAEGMKIYAAGGTNELLGEVKYAEGNKALVKLEPGKTINVGPVRVPDIDANNDITINYVMNNEAGYNLIFSRYSGPYTTAQGEYLGKDIRSVKMTLERVAIEAQTRRLKAEYTMELLQDLQAVHNLDAERELLNILEYEVVAEIDRELVERMIKSATISTPWKYKAGSGAIVADGRWEQEKFRTLYTKIVREANMIALTTRRGAGNFIIGSINVITALEGLPGFMYSAVPGDIQMGSGVVKVGTLDGRFNVYVDTFAFEDYCLVGYKGASAFDTGIVYCPYIPLMIQKVVDPETFQPRIGVLTRYSIVDNLYGTAAYYRYFKVDFSGSTLEGSYF